MIIRYSPISNFRPHSAIQQAKYSHCMKPICNRDILCASVATDSNSKRMQCYESFQERPGTVCGDNIYIIYIAFDITIVKVTLNVTWKPFIRSAVDRLENLKSIPIAEIRSWTGVLCVESERVTARHLKVQPSRKLPYSIGYSSSECIAPPSSHSFECLWHFM